MMSRRVIGTPSLVLLLLARASAQQCGSAGAHCSLWQGCCEDLKCQQKGFLNWRCIEQCVQEGQTCGGSGIEDKTCCDGMQCERHLLGTDNKQCVRQTTSATTSLPQCAWEGQTCGGPGLLDSACCDGMQCERHLLGTDNKQCVGATTTSTPALQCMQRGQICGCAGCLTQTCCGGFQCLDVSGQGGKQYCVDTSMATFVESPSAGLLSNSSELPATSTNAAMLP